MLTKLFPRLRVYPLTEQVASRDAFVHLDTGMRVCGWMPPRRWRQLYFVWSVFTSITIFFLLPVSLLASYVKDLSSFTAGQFLTSLQVGIDTFGASIKSIYTFAAVKRFEKAKQLLDIMDERCTSVEQRTHVHLTVARCNQIYMVYQFMYFMYAVSTFLSSVFKGHLTWNLYNPLIDAGASTGHFWLAASIEFLWMYGSIVQDQMADVYPTTYFLILRTHITLLKGRLRKLRTDPEMTEDENYEELIKCIQDHQRILEYCNLLRPVVSVTIFVQFLLIGIVMGFSMINIMLFSTFWSGLGTAIFMFDLILQTFPFCYVCNMIMDDCDELTYCLFHSDWIGASRRYKTTLRHFLHNLQQPIILTAGGVFIISVATNITVAKLAFSVVTFVKQMNIGEKFE